MSRKMNMSGRHPICSLVLFLTLTSASAVQKLNSINDLKQINFGHSVPKHSLVLLHWFANTIDIDNNDVILLTFEPNSGDYGTHHYGNYERMLDPLPQGNDRYRYYTLGNLNQERSMVLPSYVTQRLHNLIEYEERNRDRIIFRVREQNTDNAARWQTWQTIDRVYITQHYEASQHQGTRYDPAHTYRITTNLLREIRMFSVGEDQRNSLSDLREHFGSNTDDSQLRQLRKTWGDLACLGLLLFIVIQERLSKQSNKERSTVPPAYRGQHLARKNTQNHLVVNIPENRQNHWVIDIPQTMQNLLPQDASLQVMTGNNGNARIHWSNIPQYLLNQGVMVVLFKNNEDQETSRIFKSIGDRASGSYDTSVPLNPGLQVRLHKTSRWCCLWTTVGEEMCRGSEFPKAETPVHIRGYDARLQLFVKDGKACARLYVTRTFREWRLAFKESWVGFYSSATKATCEYESWRWQWATKFKRCTDLEDFSNDVYEYHSGMTIAPGVQARFILRDAEDVAQTPTWK